MDTESLHLTAPHRVAVAPPRADADQEIAELSCLMLLQQARLFRGLGPSELAAVARLAQRCELAAGKYFFEHGHGDVVYLLQCGRVRITQPAPRGAPVLLHLVGPGELFGAMGELRDQLRPASAQALCRCRALGWSREAIGKLMRRYPVVALNALSELEDQLCNFQYRYQHRSESPTAGQSNWNPVQQPIVRQVADQGAATRRRRGDD